MIDPRIETVTELLKKMKDLSGQLYEILSPEITSYEIVRGDLEKKRGEMRDIESQKLVAKMEIEQARNTVTAMKETAQEEAHKMVESGKSVMLDRVAQATKLLDACKDFAMELDKARYLKLRKDSEKLVANG